MKTPSHATTERQELPATRVEQSEHHQIWQVGKSRTPVIVVDGVLSLADLRDLSSSARAQHFEAALRVLPSSEEEWIATEQWGELPEVKDLHQTVRRQLNWTGAATGYPGVRASLAATGLEERYVKTVSMTLAPLVQRAFGVRLTYADSPMLAIVCTAPSVKHIGNRCPHMDSNVNDRYLASTHFIYGKSFAGQRRELGGGGISFYRQRVTGTEFLEVRHGDDDVGCENQDGTVDCEVINCVRFGGGMMAGASNEMYEHLLTIPPKQNRLIIYPTSLYHAAQADTPLHHQLVCDPGRGRLTATVFWGTSEPLRLSGMADFPH